MNKIRIRATILPILLIAALLSGCASRQTSRGLALAGGSSLGAAIAHEASSGDIAWAAGGAAIGALTAMGANAISEANERTAYREGYEAALNQSVKQQYWIIQNRQREESYGQDSESGSFVPVRIPEQEINGEIRNERIVYLRTK